MTTSEVVKCSDWEFSFRRSDARLAGTKQFRAPDIVRLATPWDLLLHLAENSADDTGFQSQIQQRLKADPVATAWHKNRRLISSMPYFSRYRKNGEYDAFHAAAYAVAAGNASKEQENLVVGLDKEIAASNLIMPNGQVLFHGRGDRALHELHSYASFISTSLDPIVCINHANKRKLQNGPQAKAIIYLLTVRSPINAIWGNGGGLKEWELLLPTRLHLTEVSCHKGTRFDVVNVTIDGRDTAEVETGTDFH